MSDRVAASLAALGCYDGSVSGMSVFQKANAVHCIQGKLAQDSNGRLTPALADQVEEIISQREAYSPNTCTRRFEEEGFFSKDYTGRREFIENLETDWDVIGMCRALDEIRVNQAPDLFAKETAVLRAYELASDPQDVSALKNDHSRTGNSFAGFLLAIFSVSDEEQVSYAESAMAAGYIEASVILDDVRERQLAAERAAQEEERRIAAVEACDSAASDPRDDRRPPEHTGRLELSDIGGAAVGDCSEAVERNPDEPRLQYQYARSLAAVGSREEALNVISLINLSEDGLAAYLGSTLTEDRVERIRMLSHATRQGHASGAELLRAGGRPEEFTIDVVFQDREGIDLLQSIQIERPIARRDEPNRIEFSFSDCVWNRMAAQGFYSMTRPTSASGITRYNFAKNFAEGECRKDARAASEEMRVRAAAERRLAVGCYDLSGQRALPDGFFDEPLVVQQVVTLSRTAAAELGIFGSEIIGERFGPVTDWAAYRFALMRGLPLSLHAQFRDDGSLIAEMSDPVIPDVISDVRSKASPLRTVLSLSHGTICGLSNTSSEPFRGP